VSAKRVTHMTRMLLVSGKRTQAKLSATVTYPEDICCVLSLPEEKWHHSMYGYREEVFLGRPTTGRIESTLQVDIPW